MGMISRFMACLIVCCISLPSVLLAAEVTNLRTEFTKTSLNIEYDLTGKRGEKDYGVEVSMVVNGTTYTSNMLTLSGDFGRMVPIGTSRKIIWTHPDDFPDGVATKFRCIVNAVPLNKLVDEAATPSDGLKASFYALNKQTVIDTRTQLMWVRNANLSKKPITYSDSKKYIEQLNREHFAGHGDWRLPTREEMEGAVYFGKKAGWGDRFAHFIADYLATCGFTNVQAGNYWTSTPDGTASGRIMVVNTWNGNLRPLDSTNYYHIWPVRNAAVPGQR